MRLAKDRMTLKRIETQVVEEGGRTVVEFELRGPAGSRLEFTMNDSSGLSVGHDYRVSVVLDEVEE